MFGRENFLLYLWSVLWPTPATQRATGSVLISDRSPVTAGLRYWYTGPVWPVTGRNRWNLNLNSNGAVQPVRTGIPDGLTGIPAGLTGNRSIFIFIFIFLFKFK